MTSSILSGIPDPLAFASDALAARGALVEASGDGCVAVLPHALSRELGIPESCTLAPVPGDAAPDSVLCALGSPLLERLSELARAGVPYTALASSAQTPRVGHARSLAERFVLRNGVFEVSGTDVVETGYLVAWFAWRAEADDRYDGMFAISIHCADGSEPDSSFATLADLTRGGNGLTLGLLPPPKPSGRILDLLVRRAASATRAAIAPACAAVARRHERDHRRIEDYFAALARDASAPRRRIEPAAIEQKVSHLVAERDAKLRDLGDRYALRVSIEPIALVALTVPVIRVRLDIRRRKRQSELALHLPATASGLDRLTCAGCGGSTARPALCDDALHTLCEQCVPQAQGRPECRAC
jgi:hypothetical protein